MGAESHGVNISRHSGRKIARGARARGNGTLGVGEGWFSPQPNRNLTYNIRLISKLPI
jgi:hypothetical protein